MHVRNGSLPVRYVSFLCARVRSVNLPEVLGLDFDHATVAVARDVIVDMGFAVTPTEGSHGRHERIFLDRMYLELDALGDRRRAKFGGWFVRPSDLTTAADALRGSAFTVEGPEPYAGPDGTWQDLAIGSDDPALPLLTIRTDVARGEWPPPLPAPHANGVCGVSYVEVVSDSPGRVREALTTLGATRNARDLLLSDGTIVDVRQTTSNERAGLVAVGFRREDGKQALLRSGRRRLLWP